jgi:hypothetical protein
MGHAVIDRFKVLDDAFRSRAGRGERLHARFAALAALSAPHDIETLIERTFELRTRLNEGLGNWRSPSRSMRLVFAAALVANERSATQFFDARDALAKRRAERGSRALTEGGSCAALALVSAGGHADQADDFYDMLDAIAAPWWRREAAREEILSAALTALGETPDEAATRIETVRGTLLSAGIPAHHANAATYEVALLSPDGGQIAGAWTCLNLAVRGRTSLRQGLGKTGLAVLSAEGDGHDIADALVRSFDAVHELRPRPTGQAAAKLAMRLAQAQAGEGSAISATRDLAAILAAQSAAIAAVASSSAAVAAAS